MSSGYSQSEMDGAGNTDCNAVQVTAALRKIWQELLHLSHIEPSDDFFDLGGDSLSAIRMLERIGSEFGEELLEPDIIYSASSFSELVTAITHALAQPSALANDHS